MKPLLEYLPPPTLCLTATCGNKADPQTLFCADCLPVQRQSLILGCLLFPFRIVARVLGV